MSSDRRQRGSVTVEGLVGMLVFFVLLTLIVQIGFLVLARNAASIALDAAVRRSATSGELVEQGERLQRDIGATVPGAVGTQVSLDSDGRSVNGKVSFDWAPPGPNLLPVRITIRRAVPVVVPP